MNLTIDQNWTRNQKRWYSLDSWMDRDQSDIMMPRPDLSKFPGTLHSMKMKNQPSPKSMTYQVYELRGRLELHLCKPLSKNSKNLKKHNTTKIPSIKIFKKYQMLLGVQDNDYYEEPHSKTTQNYTIQTHATHLHDNKVKGHQKNPKLN